MKKCVIDLKRIFSVRKKHIHIPCASTFYLLSFAFFLMFSCTSPTSSDNVTFSGTVTLQGATDFSGVTVSLYKLVELDTAITNERVKHSSVGIELTQRTEFFWRVEKAAHTTTTTADGSWEIKAEPGSYNIVAQKDGHGWRVLYEQTNSVKSNISLPVPVTLKGSYFEDLAIPANSFVVIDGRVIFNFAELKIAAGSIVEFRNNGKLDINGPLSIDGANGHEVFMAPNDTIESAELVIHETAVCLINNLVTTYLKKGFYFNTVDSIQIKYSRFNNQNTAFELFNCPKVHVENNVISDMSDGLIARETHLTLLRNFIIGNDENGIKSLSAKNSLIKNNVIKNTRGNGLGLNIGGYAYTNTFLQIYYNDFSFNNNHIYIGIGTDCIGNYNNFLKEYSFSVKTRSSTFLDTLNFRENYWGTISEIDIQNKIYDRLDRIGQPHEGPLVNYTGYLAQKINWIKNL